MFDDNTRNQVENLRPNRVIRMSIEGHATTGETVGLAFIEPV